MIFFKEKKKRKSIYPFFSIFLIQFFVKNYLIPPKLRIFTPDLKKKYLPLKILTE